MDIAVSRRAVQLDGLPSIFGLSHRGDLHLGQTDGRSSPRGNHSCPHRQRHPSSLTIPISFSLAMLQYLLYLLIIYTSGIDKYTGWIYYLYIPMRSTDMETDARKQRGMEIAATKKITKRDRGTWIVPSQTDNGRYAVTISKEGKFCTCPDFEERQQPCKHVYAVQYVLFRETTVAPDGVETIRETASVRVSRLAMRCSPQPSKFIRPSARGAS